MPQFDHRGVIEGFYGPPYRHADRIRWVEQLGRWGMNRYVYAPKDDPLHRQEWRTPYPAETLREFAELIESGRRAGVEVGFALSPGLSIAYSSSADMAALLHKFQGFAELGARFFSLALDDVPTHLTHAADRAAFVSLAAAHVALAHALRNELEGTLCLVPTDYMNTIATDYLDEMGETLDLGIEVGWTGRTVVSPSIEVAEARARAATLRRRLLLWDNYPANDGPMRTMLHLGPYVGRDPGLAEFCSGALLNPMEHSHASAVAVHTAASFLRDPAHYDCESAWQIAAAEIGAGAPEAFSRFAEAHRFSALDPDSRDRHLEAAWSELCDAWLASADTSGPIAALLGALDARATVADALRNSLRDRALAAEIEPWIESHAAETQRMRVAVEFLETLASDASRLDKALALLRMEGRLTRVPIPLTSSYGPRRVCYPQLVCLHDDAAAFGDDPMLYRDRCLADDMVAFAEEHHGLGSQR